MNLDAHALNAALAAAVGDDTVLNRELRIAFLEGAAQHCGELARARTESQWCIAAWRLQGLAASFGARTLAELAEKAANGRPGDPVALCRLGDAVAEFTR